MDNALIRYFTKLLHPSLKYEENRLAHIYGRPKMLAIAKAKQVRFQSRVGEEGNENVEENGYNYNFEFICMQIKEYKDKKLC
jgi:hypothetical protein